MKKIVEDVQLFIKSLNIKAELSTYLFSEFMYKLKTGNLVTISCIGDSMFYGTDTNSSDKRPASENKTDNGVSHTATRASITYPEALAKYLNIVYSGNVSVINKGYSGDSCKKGYEHWNASKSNLCIFNYGINDSMNSSSGSDYVGILLEYLKWYRKLIERELSNDTAVILITPFKQLITEQSDESSRIKADCYGNAVKLLAKEYNIPCIDGQILLEGVSANFYSDTTHLNGQGFDLLAARSVGAFIGDGLHSPYNVCGYDFLGANLLLDSFKLTNGARIISNASYPTPDEYQKNIGLATYIKNGQRITYSFYCDKPNMIVIPNFYINEENSKLIMDLDFGTTQSRYQNSFLIKKAINMIWEEYEPSRVEINNRQLNALNKKLYSSVAIKYTDEPRMLITSRGWHTISITVDVPNNQGITLYGLEFLDYEDYTSRVFEKNVVELTNCNAYDIERTPFIEIKEDGMVYLDGAIKEATVSNDIAVARIDPKYAPTTNQVFICSSSNLVGYYANVFVTSGGNIYLTYTSNNIGFCNFSGISWRRKTNI